MTLTSSPTLSYDSFAASSIWLLSTSCWFFSRSKPLPGHLRQRLHDVRAGFDPSKGLRHGRRHGRRLMPATRDSLHPMSRAVMILLSRSSSPTPATRRRRVLPSAAPRRPRSRSPCRQPRCTTAHPAAITIFFRVYTFLSDPCSASPGHKPAWLHQRGFGCAAIVSIAAGRTLRRSGGGPQPTHRRGGPMPSRKPRLESV
jgi:hypothetical protein